MGCSPIQKYFQDNVIKAFTGKYGLLFTNGIDCQVLKSDSSGWKKGKLKLKLLIEFIPDEPEPTQYESPLDEIRREIEASKLS